MAPGHGGTVDSRLLEGPNQPIELPQFEQVKFFDVFCQSEVSVSPWKAHGYDLEAGFGGGMSKKERKLSAPCNQSDFVKIPFRVSKRHRASGITS